MVDEWKCFHSHGGLMGMISFLWWMNGNGVIPMVDEWKRCRSHGG